MSAILRVVGCMLDGLLEEKNHLYLDAPVCPGVAEIISIYC